MQERNPALASALLRMTMQARQYPPGDMHSDLEEESDDNMGFELFDGPADELAMEHREVSVTSKGDVNASFQVSGKINIPSDAEFHNITIVKLDLKVSREWVAVPKKDPVMHMMVGVPALVYWIKILILA